MKALAHLNKYFFKYKSYLGLGILFTILSNLFGILPAQFVRYSLDLVYQNVNHYFLFQGFQSQSVFYAIFSKTILFYAVLIFLMSLLKGVFLFLIRQTLIVMSRHIEYDLKNEIYQKYQNLSLSFYRRNNTGDLMARISEDVNKVRTYVGPAIMYGLNLIVVFVMVVSYMLTVSPKLTFFVLLPLPILSVSIFFVNKIIIRRSESIQKELSSISTFVQEAFSGIRVIKAFVQEDVSVANFTEKASAYRLKSLKLIRVDSLFSPLMQLLVGISILLVVLVGGLEVMSGRLSVGVITEFIMYVYMLTWPVTALGWTTSQIQRAAASQTRINEFLQEKTDIDDLGHYNQEMKGQLSFKNVSFTYPDSGIEAISNINFDIKAGQSLAILGFTGSGKSTIANLIARMYDPTTGQISVDEQDLKSWKLPKLRSQMGYVPQDVFLFSDSIANNVRFGRNDISQYQIEIATKKANLFDNVKDFPNGFETVLGERGISLSGGQKQRLSIARAIVREPKILILDDCLSAVDTHTEHIILQELSKIMQNKTSIVISHRVSSAKLADYIIVLDQGKIVEEGTSQNLMAKNGIFKEMFEKQMQTEDTLA